MAYRYEGLFQISKIQYYYSYLAIISLAKSFVTCFRRVRLPWCDDSQLELCVLLLYSSNWWNTGVNKGMLGSGATLLP